MHQIWYSFSADKSCRIVGVEVTFKVRAMIYDILTKVKMVDFSCHFFRAGLSSDFIVLPRGRSLIALNISSIYGSHCLFTPYYYFGFSNTNVCPSMFSSSIHQYITQLLGKTSFPKKFRNPLYPKTVVNYSNGCVGKTVATLDTIN